MLALRSTLVLDPLDEAAIAAAARSTADAVLIDLAAPAIHGRRVEARTAATRAIETIAAAGRPVHARLSDTRSGELDADLDAVVGERLAAIVLSSVAVPQDVRDIDVAIRKREMRLGIAPGSIRLIAEIDSAEGLTNLARIVVAVDRHSAIALSVDGLRDDLRLGATAAALYDHAMADLAVATRTAGLSWLLAIAHHRPESIDLPSRARDFGAAGVTVHDEDEAARANALFTPDPTEVALARATVAEWERLRSHEEWVGVVAGEMPEASTYDRLVDRRTVRRARAFLATVEAIERREATR